MGLFQNPTEKGRAVCQSWLQGGKHNVTPTDKNLSDESHPGDLLTYPPFFREGRRLQDPPIMRGSREGLERARQTQCCSRIIHLAKLNPKCHMNYSIIFTEISFSPETSNFVKYRLNRLYSSPIVQFIEIQHINLNIAHRNII